MNRETSGVVVSAVLLILAIFGFRNGAEFLNWRETDLLDEEKQNDCFDRPRIAVAAAAAANDELSFIVQYSNL